MKRVRMIIAGRVQGVCFRAATLDKAKALGVCGYVKNLPDGRVEALAEAEAAILAKFVDWCHQGPMLAEVEEVNITELPVQSGEYSHFAIH